MVAFVDGDVKKNLFTEQGPRQLRDARKIYRDDGGGGGMFRSEGASARIETGETLVPKTSTVNKLEFE